MEISLRLTCCKQFKDAVYSIENSARSSSEAVRAEIALRSAAQGDPPIDTEWICDSTP